MRTFSVQTLGCKVNQYESEQLATLLSRRGLVQVDPGAGADLRVVNTCSVTTEAAAKSRQTARRAVRLTVLPSARGVETGTTGTEPAEGRAGETATGAEAVNARTGESATADSAPVRRLAPSPVRSFGGGQENAGAQVKRRARVIVTGCWATSNRSDAERLGGVDAVLTHHDDVAARLDALLDRWAVEDEGWDDQPSGCRTAVSRQSLEQQGDELWMKASAAAVGEIPAGSDAPLNKPLTGDTVKKNPAETAGGERTGERANGRTGEESPVAGSPVRPVAGSVSIGTARLPLLESRQTGHQRAFLKIQDGCDAYCTYCIIPTLRPRVSSKPVEDVVEEARRLVGAGHVELILTGIFMGAYGQETALRRRQIARDALTPLGRLIEGLCTRVPGLKRLRLSSLEPGDLTADLLGLMRSHAQVVPHFHLPLQSGSERVLRRMNRQYTRDDFLRMIDDVRAAFDRPAITTDIIVGFPGETEDEFRQTVDVAERSGFIHVHAFPFSPRPGTAAARWAKDFVRPDVAAERVRALREIGERQGLSFRRQFAGETVEVLAESSNASDDAHWQHGRTARYFAVHFQHPEGAAGRTVRVRVDEVLPDRTVGTVVGMGEA